MNIFCNTYTNFNYDFKTKSQVNFLALPKSNELKFSSDDFFVNIKGYGRNKDWVSIIKKTADAAVEKIKKQDSSDSILSEIAKGVKVANGFCKDIKKRRHTGILRTDRKGYGKTGEWNGIELVTPVSTQYKCYESKLKQLVDNPIKSPFQDINVAEIEKGNWQDYDIRIVHPDDKLVNNALDRVGGKYFNLKRDYINKPENIKEENLPAINSDIAEIRWIMAQAMPWERGSDSISNVFIRALYKSMGIKTYPLKEGISLDLQAFCTPLKEYKQNFANYFEKEPHVVG